MAKKSQNSYNSQLSQEIPLFLQDNPFQPQEIPLVQQPTFQPPPIPSFQKNVQNSLKPNVPIDDIPTSSFKPPFKSSSQVRLNKLQFNYY